MRPSVSDAFLAFSTKFEGNCPWLYLDVKGLVTTAIGCLCDSISAAQALEWIHLRTGYLAKYDEITAAWTTVKGAQGMAKLGGGAFAQLTDLRLTPDAVHRLVVGRAANFETYLRRRFTEYDGWPADAQLGLLSCAWAAGPAWAAPKFDAGAQALDFNVCSQECWLNDNGNPGLHPRNLANRVLFANAARVLERGLDSTTLYYPQTL